MFSLAIVLSGITAGLRAERAAATINQTALVEPVVNDAATVAAQIGSKAGLRNQQQKLPTVYAETDPNSTTPAIYIVQLGDLPIATYQGELSGLAATSPLATGMRKVDVRSTAATAYRAYLAEQQASFLRAAESLLGRPVAVLYHYTIVFNGVAVKLSPVEAARLVKLASVASLQRSQWRHTMTDASPAFLNVPGVWNGTTTGGLPGTKGEGVIVGIIDSGIWPEHPSFADDGSYPAPPVTWQGECTAPADGSLAYQCNNKLIGVQYFLEGYSAFGGYDGLFLSGRDDNGHGTHTASTAAGNEGVPAAIYGINRGLVSGMAPRAYVAAYKGLGPQGGTTEDLAAAIDKAVADGVDVINYSVGSDFAADPWIDVDAQAYLAATAAGVFVATSAGNAGPGVSTIGSPANAPWVTSVGASYFNRLYLSEITLQASGGMSLAGLYGATSTPGVTNFRLVNAEGIEDSTGDTAGDCGAPFSPGTFQATDVVLCPSGAVATTVIGNYVNAGGASAVIIYNAQGSFDLNSYLYSIPAVRVLTSTGAQILQFIADHPGETITASFTQGNPIFSPDPRVPVDTVVGFSSRGPNINESTNHLINVIKPDVTAPGIHILAGASPQYVVNANGVNDRYGGQGQLFQLVQGTSMSSPHVAGAGALLKALYPDWSPSQIRSALMTGAVASNQLARRATGDYPANPFDLGAGRIDLARAPLVGFVLDETAANFSAADPALGGDPSTLNLASLTQNQCVTTCTWVRTLQSTQSAAVDWSVSANVPPTLTLTVNPPAFTLAASATQVVTITADVSNAPFAEWAFGTLIFTPNSGQTVAAHFPVAVYASAGEFAANLDIETRRNAGAFTATGLRLIDVPNLAVKMLASEPQTQAIALAEDQTNQDAYDLAAGGVYTALVTVPATAHRLVVEILASTAPDLDLFVGLDTNGNGLPDEDEELCASTSFSWQEYCDFPQSSSELPVGTYWILIQNWEGSGAALDAATYAVTLLDDNSIGALSVVGPTSTTLNAPFSIQIGWNIPDFTAGQLRYGLVQFIDADANQVLGASNVSLARLQDDVLKSVFYVGAGVQPGDTLTYTIDILAETSAAPGPVQYTLTDTLPAGTTLIPGSASLAPTVLGDQLLWSLTVITQEIISYAVVIDAAVTLPTTLINRVDHSVNLPGTALATITHTLAIPDVLLVASLAGPPTVTSGANIVYTLTVSNHSTSVAPNVVAETQLPPGTAYVSGGEFMNDTIRFTLGDIAGRSSKSVAWVVAPQPNLLASDSVSTAALETPTIIGGIEAKAGAWPWQVALMNANISNGYLAQFCAGSLITPNWVLTAAHCVLGESVATFNIAVGRHRLSANDGQRLPISQIVIHPGYDDNALVPPNDIALVRLAQPAQLTGTIGLTGAVQLLQLASPSEPALVMPDLVATVIGWGDRSNGLGNYADTLRQVTVPLVSNATCRMAYDAFGYPFGSITENMICAGFVEGGKDACYGDSGGPLMVRAGNGVWKQIGIVSTGEECALPEGYGIYTHVPQLYEWIVGPGTNTYLSAAIVVTDDLGHTVLLDEEQIVTLVQAAATKLYLPLIGR